MELERAVGLKADGSVLPPQRSAAIRSILLKLAAMGVRIPEDNGDQELLHMAGDLFARYREQTRLLSQHLCPADARIQRYIDKLLADVATTASCAPARGDLHSRPIWARSGAVASGQRRCLAQRTRLKLST